MPSPMVEGGAHEILEEDVVDALQIAHEGIREICSLQEELIDGLRQPTMEWTPVGPPPELSERIAVAARPRDRKSTGH